MTDITSHLAAALAGTTQWSRESFIGLLESVAAAVNDASIDWDEGAGENWGRVLVGSEVMAIVFRLHPLMIVRSTLHDYDVPAGVVVLVVDDMSADVFSVDRNVAEKLAGRALSSDWNAGQFSIDALWWATVT
jgi:hypothetical protein